jgi:hypothetical protein
MRICLREFCIGSGEIWFGILLDVRSSYPSGCRRNLLRVDKAFIHTVESNKLFVGFLFSDFTFGEDDDVVCVSNCGKTVRDTYSRARGRGHVKSILDDSFRLILVTDGNIPLYRAHSSPRRATKPSGLKLSHGQWRRVAFDRQIGELRVPLLLFHNHLEDSE